MIRLENISFRYEEKQGWIFDSFNLQTKPGEIIMFRGKSGCGKTTLLNIICGVIPKMMNGELEGQVYFGDKLISDWTLPQTAPHISMLMQNPILFFPIVEHELAFAPENLNLPPTEIKERIDKVIDQLALQDIRFQETANLSYGQKKLVNLAALLTLSPQVYLLDEPSAGLSDQYLKLIETIISNLAEEKKTVLITDHEKHFHSVAHRVIDL